MARPGVTYHEVSNAAQQQIAAGKTPTIESIRIALGTGSHSTLGPMLRTWKLQNSQTQQLASKEKIPEELIAALKGIWEMVMNQAQDKIAHIHQEAERVSLELKHEIQNLEKNNHELQRNYLQTKEAHDALVQEKSTLEEIHGNIKIELASFKEKLSGAQQNNLEKQAQIDELHHLNKQAQANLEHYRNASLEQRLADQERFDQQQQQLEKVIAETNNELIYVKQEMKTAEQHNQQFLQINGDLKNKLSELKFQQASLEEKLEKAQCKITDKTDLQQKTQNQLLSLETKYNHLTQAHLDLKTSHVVTLQKLAILENEFLEIKSQNKQLTHEKWLIGQEKAEIQGKLKQLEMLYIEK